MRHLARFVLAALAILSLSLSLAIGGLWVRSYRKTDLFDWIGAGASAGAVSSRGSFRYYQNSTADGSMRHFKQYHNAAPQTITIAPNPSSPVIFAWRAGGLYYSGGVGGRYVSWDLIAPDWIPCALALLLPLAWFRSLWKSRLRRRRLKEGLCAVCGYDLRASEGRCPECGAAKPAEANGARTHLDAPRKRGG